MKVSIAGAPSVKIGDAQNFIVTLKNTSDRTCRIAMDSQKPALRVTSGTDSIWSSASCTSWGPTANSQPALPGNAVAWRASWKTARATSSCTPSTEPLRAGTYVAKASFGDSSARLVMKLHG